MLGILGLGSHSTLHYIKQLNLEYNIKHGGYSTMPFKMLNVDFNLINPYLPNNFEQLIPIVSSSLQELNKLGVTKIIVPNITLHEAIDKSFISSEIKEKIVHPLKVLTNPKLYAPFENVCILGTQYTMSNSYIIEKLKLPVKVLSADDIANIDNIRKELYKGISDTTQYITYFNQLIIKNDKTLFIIACTELSLVAHYLNSRNNILDLVDEQIKSCVS
jgi:aspartate racemase